MEIHDSKVTNIILHHLRSSILKCAVYPRLVHIEGWTYVMGWDGVVRDGMGQISRQRTSLMMLICATLVSSE